MKLLKFPSAELVFFLFVISGTFKEVLPFITLDLTILLMLWSMAIVFFRFIRGEGLPKLILAPATIYFVLGLLILVSYFYSSSSAYGLEKSFKFLTVTAWTFFGGFLVIRDKQSLNKFFKSALLSAVALSLYGIYEYFTNYNPLIQYRFGLGGNPLALAQISSLGALIALAFVLHSANKKIHKLLLVSLSGALAYTCILTGSRMPIVSLGLSLILIFLLSIRVRGKDIRIKKGLIPFFLTLAVLLVVFLSNSSQSTFQTFNDRFEMLLSGKNDASASERINRYEFAFDMFKESPIIGKGIGSFAVEYEQIDARSYPHNIFLEVLSEMGLLGLMLLVGLLVIGLKRMLSGLSKKLYSERVILIAVFLFAFLNANVSSDLNDNRLFFCFLGLACMLPKINKEAIVELENAQSKRRFKKYKLTW